MFKLKENHTTVKTELLAGLTTFMSMAYILMVNAGMFTDIEGNPVTYGAIYISTALSAIIGSVLIGLLANLPLAQAPGMGLNAFFVYTICNIMHFSYANTLVIVLFDGLLFVLLTVTGLRKAIFGSIPHAVKAAISSGIGLFIAFLGFQNTGLIVNSESTLVDLHSFNLLYNQTTWAEILPIFITILAIVLIGALSKMKVRGAVFFGILLGTVLYYALGLLTVPDFFKTNIEGNLSLNIVQPFKDFFNLSFAKVFTEGFDFSAYINANGVGSFVITLLASGLAMCMIDMFDTLGTLYGACSVGGILDKDGNVPRMNKAMLSDAIATCTGAVFGNCTVTSFVESSAGVAEGGRTGLTSIFTAMFFFIAMFFAPFAALIPECATAAALVYVGILMMSSIKDIDWSDPSNAVPAFFTISIMPFTYNISYGIAFGLLSYILIKLFSKRFKDINIGTWIIGILFVIMFFVSR
ncbi:MAG: NCS2 family permease [Clostridia bacterium]|nr:NCS2 family permease [Clostridia bacterium]